MKSIYYTVLFMSSLISCNIYKEYHDSNKPKYNLSVGESIELYYSTNSCCYYCIVNQNKLDNIQFVDQKTIDSGPKDCEGCNHTAAFVFKAISVGIDTVYLRHVSASTPIRCDSNSSIAKEMYIVDVK